MHIKFSVVDFVILAHVIIIFLVIYLQGHSCAMEGPVNGFYVNECSRVRDDPSVLAAYLLNI